jgi:hypothetical protein
LVVPLQAGGKKQAGRKRQANKKRQAGKKEGRPFRAAILTLLSDWKGNVNVPFPLLLPDAGRQLSLLKTSSVAFRTLTLRAGMR